MDFFINGFLRHALHPDAHPYCIPVGTPIRFHILRTIPPSVAREILEAHGHTLLPYTDSAIEDYPNPTAIACFGNLYNFYDTLSFTHDGTAALGEALARVPGADMARLGRCVGYSGDIMPKLSPAPPLDGTATMALVASMAVPSSGGAVGASLQLDALMAVLGGRGSIWGALRIYSLYFRGAISRSPSMGQPLYGGIESNAAELQALLRAKWISWEGQAATEYNVRNGCAEPRVRHPNLMLAVPTYAIAGLVEHLLGTPYAFAVASAWPLHYGLIEWRVREAYVTGRTDPGSKYTGAEDLGVAATWNYLYGHSRAPGAAFRSMYVTVCVHAAGPTTRLLADMATFATDMRARDEAWHAAVDADRA